MPCQERQDGCDESLLSAFDRNGYRCDKASQVPSLLRPEGPAPELPGPLEAFHVADSGSSRQNVSSSTLQSPGVCFATLAPQRPGEPHSIAWPARRWGPYAASPRQTRAEAAAEYCSLLVFACNLDLVPGKTLVVGRGETAQTPTAVDVEEARVVRTHPGQSLLNAQLEEMRQWKTQQQAGEWARRAGPQDQGTAATM